MVAAVLVGVLAFRSADADEPRVVTVVVSGHPEVTRSLEVVVRELLGRLPVKLDWSVARGIDPREVLLHRGSHAEILARAWVDVSDPEKARIYVANGESERFVLRFLALEHGYDEIAREELGHIVESAVDAFLAGGDVGVDREAAEQQVRREEAAAPPLPAPAPPSTPPPLPVAPPSVALSAAPAAPSVRAPIETAVRRPPSRLARFDVTAAYMASAIAEREVEQGPLVDVALSLPQGARVRFALALRGEYVAPYRWDAAPVGARFEGASFALGLGVSGDVGRRATWSVTAGAGAEVLHVSPFAEVGAAGQASSPFVRALPMASFTAALSIAVVPSFGLVAAAGAWVDLSGTTYDLRRDESLAPVLSPWLVRPFGYVGALVAWDNARTAAAAP